MRQFSVMVARFPGNNQEHPASSGWVIETAIKMSKDPRISRLLPVRISDTPISMSRNRAAKQALDNNCDYLLMIDSDMMPDLPYPGAKKFWDSSWEFMVRRRDNEESIRASGGDQPGQVEEHLRTWYAPATVAAPYCGPAPDECVYVFQWTAKETGAGNPQFALTMIPREDAALRSGFQEVPALPTGLILYDTRVFQSTKPPWYCYEYEDEYECVKVTTEDVYQTRNAGLAKCPQYVNWDAWAGHIKLKIVPKPEILTQDVVQAHLAKAILSGRRIGEKVVVLTQEPPPYKASLN